MKIDVYHTPLGLNAGDLTGRAVVVIDVLRATSTIVTALAAGAKAIVPAASSEEVVRVTANLEKNGIVLAGERRLLKIEGFNLGNSPREMTKEAVGGKTLFLATTNGTPALLAAQGGDPVLVAAALNFSAVADRARHLFTERGDLVIICAGREKQFALEDAYTAGRLIKAVKKGVPPKKLSLNDAAQVSLDLAALGGWQDALAAGLTLLIPYGIAVAIGPIFPPDYASWTRSERLVGLFPGFLANGIEGAIGTAGAVLAGVFALSAVSILTVGWHPLTVLRQRKREVGVARSPRAAGPGLAAREEPVRTADPGATLRAERDRKPKPKPAPPPRPVPPPPPRFLIPPIELLTEGPGAVEDVDAAQIEDMGRRLVNTL